MKEKIINELEASLTQTSNKQSEYGMKNNPYLLQVAEVANYDADLTEYTSKTNKEYDNMGTSEK